ncbi:hypothetical protein XENTR_v10014822 [Xenopus tropicalis]|nr:hypothetical protein XENTR_v10014822 [Xenopus tropicalis]
MERHTGFQHTEWFQLKCHYTEMPIPFAWVTEAEQLQDKHTRIYCISINTLAFLFTHILHQNFPHECVFHLSQGYILAIHTHAHF